MPDGAKLPGGPYICWPYGPCWYMGGYIQPASANNDNGAVILMGNLDILSVSCNVLVRLPCGFNA